MAQYRDLINRGGTIYNQATGQGYATPAALATDLGIAPHQIDWSQITAAGGQGDTGTTTANPITSFNSAIMAKLKSYQGLSSADLIKRQSTILKRMYQKQGQITPEEQRVLSPTQQQAIRGGQVSALRPELEATKGQILDRKEARSRFLEMVGVAQDFSKQLEDIRGQQKDTALQALEIRAQAGDVLTQSEISNLSSLTGWNPQDVQSYFDVASQAAATDRTLQDLKIANEKKRLAGGGDDDIYGKYSSRLNSIVDDVYSGRYGTTGAREKALQILKNEFPDKDVSRDIYARIPDGYETQVKTTDTDAQFQSDFQDAMTAVQNKSIKKKAAKARLLNKYPLKAKDIEASWDIIF